MGARHCSGLPEHVSIAFTTGCHMANFTALAAARHEVLRRAGWDVESDGLQRAPRLRVVVGNEVHVSVVGALRTLGVRIARSRSCRCRRPGAHASGCAGEDLDRGERSHDRLCSGGQCEHRRVRPFLSPSPISADDHRAWLHVDGAFGLWAGASSALRHHVQGVARADSWATDAHKWLNVPYRLRSRVHRSSGGTPGRAQRQRGLPRAECRGAPRADGLDA